MTWLPRIFRRSDLYNDLAEEMREHLEEKTEQFVREGMSREEAEQAARRAFGNATLIEERSREVWQWPTIESIWANVKYALRQMRKSPGFALVAVVTLALGIGVNSTIFTVFDQVLLRAMPVPKAGELILLSEHSQFETGGYNSWGGPLDLYFSYPAYLALRRDNHAVDDLAVSANAPVSIVSAHEADKATMQLVSGNYFHVLGVQPVLGRLLSPADDRYHAGNPVAVLSESYWRMHFGADPSILNQSVLLNGTPFTIVGIVPHRGLMDGQPTAAFVPVSMEHTLITERNEALSDPLNRWLNIVGRLAPGVSRAQAETQLNVLWWNWRRDTLNLKKNHIGDQKAWLQTHLTVSNGARGISLLEEDFSDPLKILQAMALVVLLIVCGNVANLLLAKAARKHSELAMRAALGASRRRILQQMMVEGLLLGLMGAAAGLPLGWATLKPLLHMAPESATLRIAFSARMDWRTVAFSALTGILTSLVFSLAPAIVSTRIALLQALRRQSPAVAGGGKNLRHLLVVSQIALSLSLLACATVFAWSLYKLRSIQPGFPTGHLVTFRADAAAQGKTGPQTGQEYTSIVDGLQRLPGVRSVVYSADGLVTGNRTNSGHTIVSGYTPADPKQDLSTDHDAISAGFFSAMQIPLLAGREFTQADMEPDHKVAIVDQVLVNRYFGGDISRALGGQLGFSNSPDLRIVGVVPSIHKISLTTTSSTPFVYLPYNMEPVGSYVKLHPANFYIRTTGEPATLIPAVRAFVHGIDSNLPITGLETMGEHLDDVLFQNRLITMLSVAIGSLALVLAAIGLYGVLTLSVAERTREIGIRIAVGANRGEISALIAKQVGRLVLAGVAVGALLGWIGIRVLTNRDNSLAHAPMWLFGATGFALLFAMCLATLLPAHKAASVDPIQALRSE